MAGVAADCRRWLGRVGSAPGWGVRHVKELQVETLRWLVVVLVVYAALLLINVALRGPRPESREELIAAALD